MVCKQVPRKTPLTETLWSFHNVSHYTLYQFTLHEGYLKPSGGCGDRESCSAEISPACPPTHMYMINVPIDHIPCLCPQGTMPLSNFVPSQTIHRLWIQITEITPAGIQQEA